MQTGCCEIECLFYWDGGLRNWLGDISVVDYVVGSEVGKRLQRYILIEKSFYGKFTCGIYIIVRRGNSVTHVLALFNILTETP